MKFAIEGAHRQFFRKHQCLELQGMLNDSQLQDLGMLIEKSMEERLKTKPGRAFQELPAKIFSSGRDLFRSNDQLKKLILNNQFAEIASELIEFRPLRFGFDQLYSTVLTSTKERDDFNPYKKLVTSPKTLNTTTCLQGVLCGLMICLKNDRKVTDEKPASNEERISIFSKTPGNAVYFSPDMLIDFNELISDETARYLMIVYTHSTAIYYLEESDPQTHVFKSLGYVFGDRLSDRLNPIIFR
jgi:hypothetical protein